MGLSVSKVVVGGTQLFAGVNAGWFPDDNDANNLNQSLQQKGFVVIKNYISSEVLTDVADKFIESCNKGSVATDKSGNLGSANETACLQILVERTAAVGKIFGEPVLPTYTYAKLYKAGSTVSKHSEREPCEISLLANFGPSGKGGANWPIVIEKPDGTIEDVCIGVGDALLYYGHNLYKHREFFQGEETLQVYFHYVKSRGKYSEYYFDRRP